MEMYRDLPLRWVTIAVAMLLATVWIGGALAPEKFRRALLKFPRNVPLGIALMTAGAAWCVAIVWQANPVPLLAPKFVAYALIGFLLVGCIVWKLDYLAVRALSLLLLLVAKVMLDAAFMVETPAKLLVPTLAYVWIVAAMWWAMTPWRCRNAIEWAAASDARIRAVSGAHLAIAVALAVFALAFY